MLLFQEFTGKNEVIKKVGYSHGPNDKNHCLEIQSNIRKWSPLTSQNTIWKNGKCYILAIIVCWLNVIPKCEYILASYFCVFINLTSSTIPFSSSKVLNISSSLVNENSSLYLPWLHQVV